VKFLSIFIGSKFLNRTIILTIFSILLITLADPIYGTTDDKILAGFVDGSYTGDLELRSIFIQPITNVFMLPFYYILPNFGWYFLFQLFFLILGLSLVSDEINAIKPILNNLIFAISIIVLSWFVPQPTFTAASFLICLIGILLLILIANRVELDKFRVFAVVVFLLYSFALRTEAFLGTLSLLIVPICFHYRKILKLILKNLSMIILVSLVFFPANYMLLKITNNSGWQVYDNWNSHRHQLQNRISQNFILENIDKIGWSVPEHNLFVDLSYGDVSTFNSDWIKPAFDLTRDKTGITGMVNADFSPTANKLIKIIVEQQAFSIGVFILLLVLLLVFITYRSLIALIFSVTSVLLCVYFISSTLHAPERIVVPLIFSTLFIYITLIINDKQREIVDTNKQNLLIGASILLALVSHNGFLDSYKSRHAKIEYSENVKRVLDPFSKRYILIGSVGTEVNHLTNPYYQSVSQNEIKSIIAGNWETFSPYWYKRNEKLGVVSKNIYQELISNSKAVWITKKIPDTSYSIELYLRERQINGFNRTGITTSLYDLNLYHFTQK
jgi:hypothetical protein